MPKSPSTTATDHRAIDLEYGGGFDWLHRIRAKRKAGQILSNAEMLALLVHADVRSKRGPFKTTAKVTPKTAAAAQTIPGFKPKRRR